VPGLESHRGVADDLGVLPARPAFEAAEDLEALEDLVVAVDVDATAREEVLGPDEVRQLSPTLAPVPVRASDGKEPRIDRVAPGVGGPALV